MLIPIPIHELEEEREVLRNDPERDNQRILRYLDCPNWKCPKCRATMFGRCKFCGYCQQRLSINTLRPESYIEPPV